MHIKRESEQKSSQKSHLFLQKIRYLNTSSEVRRIRETISYTPLVEDKHSQNQLQVLGEERKSSKPRGSRNKAINLRNQSWAKNENRRNLKGNRNKKNAPHRHHNVNVSAHFPFIFHYLFVYYLYVYNCNFKRQISNFSIIIYV